MAAEESSITKQVTRKMKNRFVAYIIYSECHNNNRHNFLRAFHMSRSRLLRITHYTHYRSNDLPCAFTDNRQPSNTENEINNNHITNAAIVFSTHNLVSRYERAHMNTPI